MLAVLKTTFSKNKQKELFYRDYKKINFSDFNDELKTILSRNNVGSCYQFDQILFNFQIFFQIFSNIQKFSNIFWNENRKKS